MPFHIIVSFTCKKYFTPVEDICACDSLDYHEDHPVIKKTVLESFDLFFIYHVKYFKIDIK